MVLEAVPGGYATVSVRPIQSSAHLARKLMAGNAQRAIDRLPAGREEVADKLLR